MMELSSIKSHHHAIDRLLYGLALSSYHPSELIQALRLCRLNHLLQKKLPSAFCPSASPKRSFREWRQHGGTES